MAAAAGAGTTEWADLQERIAQADRGEFVDFVAKAEQAAERLNVASSAINRQILALEAELGTPIFHRLPRRLRLTATGEVVISHVRETLKEHRRVQSRIHDLKGLSVGEDGADAALTTASEARHRIRSGE